MESDNTVRMTNKSQNTMAQWAHQKESECWHASLCEQVPLAHLLAVDAEKARVIKKNQQ